MSHSKRNTSLAFFTAHERALLRGTWGSQSARLSSASALPFGHCTLCLLPAVEPVACCGFTRAPANIDEVSSKRKRRGPTARKTHIFCRACALENILAQKQDLKRLASAAASQAQLAEAHALQTAEARAERELRAFEAAQSGLSGNGAVRVGDKGAKRERADNDERDVAKRARSSFWVPSETPDALAEALAGEGAGADMSMSAGKTEKKLSPLCPGSLDDEAPHAFSLQSLAPVVFTEEKGTGKDSVATRVCPACSKPLSNSSKALMASPCGHVVCGSCADKFVLGGTDDAGESVLSPEEETKIACFVCGQSLVEESGAKAKAEHGKKSKTSKLRRGLLEISCEGTGYAGGGNNMVKRAGVAFQC